MRRAEPPWEGGAQRALLGDSGQERGGEGVSKQRCSRLLPEHVAAELLRHRRLQPAPLPGPLPGHPLPAKLRGPQKARRGPAAGSTVSHVSRRAREPGRAGPGWGRSRAQQRAAESSPSPEGKFPPHLVCSRSLKRRGPSTAGLRLKSPQPRDLALLRRRTRSVYISLLAPSESPCGPSPEL